MAPDFERDLAVPASSAGQGALRGRYPFSGDQVLLCPGIDQKGWIPGACRTSPSAASGWGPSRVSLIKSEPLMHLEKKVSRDFGGGGRAPTLQREEGNSAEFRKGGRVEIIPGRHFGRGALFPPKGSHNRDGLRVT